MGWAVGYDDNWGRWIGYGVPATCDYPGCGTEIDRGLAYVCCDQQPYGGDEGCGLFFCFDHPRIDGKCERCAADADPFDRTPDTAEWINHMLSDESWGEWRAANPDEEAAMRKQGTHA